MPILERNPLQFHKSGRWLIANRQTLWCCIVETAKDPINLSVYLLNTISIIALKCGYMVDTLLWQTARLYWYIVLPTAAIYLNDKYAAYIATRNCLKQDQLPFFQTIPNQNRLGTCDILPEVSSALIVGIWQYPLTAVVKWFKVNKFVQFEIPDQIAYNTITLFIYLSVDLFYRVLLH